MVFIKNEAFHLVCFLEWSGISILRVNDDELHRLLRAGMWLLVVWWEGPGWGKSFSDAPQVRPCRLIQNIHVL